MPPISARVLAALVAAGATTDQLVAAVKAEEAAEEERKERRREKERLKKQRYRAKHCPPMSPGTTGDSAGPPSFPLTLSLSPPVVGGGGNAREAANAEARAEAEALAQDVLLILDIDPQFAPNWDTSALARWLQAGIAGGWQSDVVRIATRKVAAQRRGQEPIGSFRYLEKPIVREHGNAARPVPPAPDQDQPHAETQGKLTLVRTYPGGGGGFTAQAAAKARQRSGGG